MFLTTILKIFFNNIKSIAFTEYSGNLNIDYKSGHDTESLRETLTQRRTECSKISIINPGEKNSGELTHNNFCK